MNRAKEYRDPETGGLYYDHTTIYKKEKKMVELKAIAGALVLISVLYFIWRD